VFVFDCTLTSPAFTDSNFFPWCIADIPEDMFASNPSLSHIYTSFTTSVINATSTTAPICRLQGRAALSTITSVLSRQCVAHNQESDLSAPSRVDLLRIHVDKDSLPCFQKVALPQNSRTVLFSCIPVLMKLITLLSANKPVIILVIFVSLYFSALFFNRAFSRF
jgi:hypothetical protein